MHLQLTMDITTLLIAKPRIMLNSETAMVAAFKKILEMRLKPKGDFFRYNDPIQLPKKLLGSSL